MLDAVLTSGFSLGTRPLPWAAGLRRASELTVGTSGQAPVLLPEDPEVTTSTNVENQFTLCPTGDPAVGPASRPEFKTKRSVSEIL